MNFQDIKVQRSASFSRCKQYRYTLSRTFDCGSGHCVFIGLNPSTADVKKDDPTIRRCMGFATNWGYRQITVVNLFAFRTPHPAELIQATNPEGKNNLRALRRACTNADCIVAAWGAHHFSVRKAAQLSSLWSQHTLYSFGQTANGQPIHPLYQRKDAVLTRYQPSKH